MRPIFCSLILLLAAGAAHADDADPDDRMAAVLRARVHTLVGCYELAEGRVSKSSLDLVVQPGGHVSHVSIDGRLPRAIGSCVMRRARSWKFPPFNGQARRVSASLIFVAAPDDQRKSGPADDSGPEGRSR